jgi:hypothetical protein
MRPIREWLWNSLIVTAVLAGCSSVIPSAGGGHAANGPSSAPAPAIPIPPCYTTYCKRNAIVPRWQWLNNAGYCGEIAMITAGMHYGQYTSEYTARQLASGQQWNRSKYATYQLLLGVNATHAATAMDLISVSFATPNPSSNGPTTAQFLVWVKQHVLAGQPVIIGVYENAGLYGSDAQYDHIVPVIGVGSNHSLATEASTYYADDYLIFSDNGIYGPYPPKTLAYPATLPPFYFPNTWTYGSYDDLDSYPHYQFSKFVKTRAAATASQTSYALAANTAANDYPGNYGIAITGIADGSNETLPVSLTTNKLLEFPYISQGKKSNPTPTAPPADAITIAVSVSGLKTGTSYNIYEYDGANDTFPSVPTATINKLSKNASNHWSIKATGPAYAFAPTPKPGGSYLSNQSVVFRAVPASAP